MWLWDVREMLINGQDRAPPARIESPSWHRSADCRARRVAGVFEAPFGADLRSQDAPGALVGYSVALNDAPLAIVDHVAKKLRVTRPTLEELARYQNSAERARHWEKVASSDYKRRPRREYKEADGFQRLDGGVRQAPVQVVDQHHELLDSRIAQQLVEGLSELLDLFRHMPGLGWLQEAFHLFGHGGQARYVGDIARISVFNDTAPGPTSARLLSRNLAQMPP